MTPAGTEPVRLRAIGLGRWVNALADAYTRSDAVELVACFTRSEDKLRAFSHRFDCEAETSLEALLARDNVEGVIVTVPNDQHADVIEEAARAGKHAFVEKPIAIDLEDARRIERATSSADVVFACGHSARRLGGTARDQAHDRPGGGGRGFDHRGGIRQRARSRARAGQLARRSGKDARWPADATGRAPDR